MLLNRNVHSSFQNDHILKPLLNPLQTLPLNLAPQFSFKKSFFYTRAKNSKSKVDYNKAGISFIYKCVLSLPLWSPWLLNKLLNFTLQLPGSSIISLLYTMTFGDVFRRCYIKLWTFWHSHYTSESDESESFWYTQLNWMDLSSQFGMLLQCFFCTYLTGGVGEISVFN